MRLEHNVDVWEGDDAALARQDIGDFESPIITTQREEAWHARQQGASFVSLSDTACFS